MSNSSEEDAISQRSMHGKSETVSFSNHLSAASTSGPSSSNTSLAATSVDTTLSLQPTAGAVAATDLHEGTPSILNYFRKIKQPSIRNVHEKKPLFIIY